MMDVFERNFEVDPSIMWQAGVTISCPVGFRDQETSRAVGEKLTVSSMVGCYVGTYIHTNTVGGLSFRVYIFIYIADGNQDPARQPPTDRRVIISLTARFEISILICIDVGVQGSTTTSHPSSMTTRTTLYRTNGIQAQLFQYSSLASLLLILRVWQGKKHYS
jgi:hypothetical protein